MSSIAKALGLTRSARIHSQVKTQVGGYSFSSKLEASVYQTLLFREKAKEIQVLQCQDHVYLTLARVACIPDFKCLDLKTGNLFWVEAKGFETDRWAIIQRLWKFYGPGPLEVWRASPGRKGYERPFCQKTILTVQNNLNQDTVD